MEQSNLCGLSSEQERISREAKPVAVQHAAELHRNERGPSREGSHEVDFYLLKKHPIISSVVSYCMIYSVQSITKEWLLDFIKKMITWSENLLVKGISRWLQKIKATSLFCDRRVFPKYMHRSRGKRTTNSTTDVIEVSPQGTQTLYNNAEGHWLARWDWNSDSTHNICSIFTVATIFCFTKDCSVDTVALKSEPLDPARTVLDMLQIHRTVHFPSNAQHLLPSSRV